MNSNARKFKVLTGNNEIKTEDSGLVVFRLDTQEYFCGLNKFDRQLRKAKIYHSKKWADAAVEWILDNKRGTQAQDLIVLPVDLRININKLGNTDG